MTTAVLADAIDQANAHAKIRKATTKEIRAKYKKENWEIRISRTGEIKYRRENDRNWLDGRNVTDYYYDLEYGVYLK